jgi:hypothetical protein
VTRLIDHFNTRLVTTSNYNAIADLHTLQINITQTSVLSLLQSPIVVSGYRLLTVEILQLPRSLRCPLANTPRLSLAPTNSQAGCQFTPTSYSSQSTYNWLLLGWCSRYITPWHGSRKKRRFQHFLYFCAWTRCLGNLFVSWPLPSKRSIGYNIRGSQ